MELHRCLGIYLAKDRATCVLVTKSAGKFELLSCFDISADQQEESQGSLAETVGRKCREKNWTFSQVAMAVDCEMFTQQDLNSDFTETKQIAQTIKFDAEESLAVDAAKMAIATEVVSKGQTGSQVSVFAAQRDLLTDIIVALQGYKLDPATVEPDVICMRRFISQSSTGDEADTIWAQFSNHNCYITSNIGAKEKPAVRAFLTSPSQDKTAVLTREVTMMTAARPQAGQLSSLQVCDTTGSVDLHDLGERLGIDVEGRNLIESVLAEQTDEHQYTEPLEVVVACGAAMGQLTRTERVDFRADFLPYQGRKALIEKTVKIASISLTLMLIVLGVFAQMKMLQTNGYRSRLRENLKAEYAIAMPGTKFPEKGDFLGKLDRTINHIKDVKDGQLSASGKDSPMSKLTYVLEAFNDTPKEVDLDILAINISPKDIMVSGSTNSGKYLKLYSSIDDHSNLRRATSRREQKNNRENFRMTLELK